MKNKKKVLIPVISTLAVGLLVGVGFATWTIAGQSVTKSVDGNTINAETIADKRVTLTTSAVAQTISFSSKASDAITNPWLSRDGASEEKLGFTFSFTLASQDGASKINDIVSNIAYKITVTDADGGWAKAVTANYVSDQISFTAPETKSVKIGAETTYAATSYTAASQVVTITGSFAWGIHFGSQNPYSYYNAKQADATLTDGTTTYVEDAKKSLGELKSDLNDVKFTLSVTATPKNS